MRKDYLSILRSRRLGVKFSPGKEGRKWVLCQDKKTRPGSGKLEPLAGAGR